MIQKAQRYPFDRCFTLPGSKLVEVGDESGCTPEDMEAAIGPNTAAIAYFIQPQWDSSVLSLEHTVEVARSRDVPVIADAASQIYPQDYFRSRAQGADLVCFGAKYFGSPHSTGIVTGKKNLVDAVVAQGFIAFHLEGNGAFGRPMKVDRQEVVGVVAALDLWFSMNHEDRLMEIDRRISVIQDGLSEVANVRTELDRPMRFTGPTLKVVVDPGALGRNAQQVADELAEESPRIWVGVRGDDTLTLVVHNLNEGEETIVARTLRSVLTG